MADAVDSKSTGNNLVGSTPTAGTNFFPRKWTPFAHGARDFCAFRTKARSISREPCSPSVRAAAGAAVLLTFENGIFLFFYGLPSAGSTRWHITVLPLRFSTGQSVGLVGRWVLGIVCQVYMAF